MLQKRDNALVSIVNENYHLKNIQFEDLIDNIVLKIAKMKTFLSS
jgi:hypothetical protein